MKFHKSLLKLPLFIKIIIIIGILAIGWISINRIKSAATKTSQYQTGQVEKGTVVSQVSASGQVLTSNVVNIVTQATGVVKRVLVKDGDIVSTGQKIAEITLDSTSAQKNATARSSYLAAKNTVDLANVTLLTLQSDMFDKWDIFKNLAESSAYQNPDGSPRNDKRAAAEFHIAQKDWLAAEQKFKNQQNVIVQAKVALNSSWLSYQALASLISSPMAGTISNITIVPGMILSNQSSTSDTTATLGTRIAVIKSSGKPLISVNLSEIDVPKVKIGQNTAVTIDAIADKTFTGKVVSVDRIGTTTQGVTNYPTIIELDDMSEDLLPNMSASANIILESKKDVLIVPASAIKTRDQNYYVLVFKNGKEQLVPVKVGLSSDSQIEIISELKQGDEVILGTINSANLQRSTSPFGTFGGGGFSSGALRPGGFRR